MCLGIPGEILEVNGAEARAEFWDVEKTVRIDIVGESVEPGDYVLNHAGFAIRKIPDEEVEETLALYESYLRGDEDEALAEIGAAGEALGLDGDDAEAGGAGSDATGPAGSGESASGATDAGTETREGASRASPSGAEGGR
jgi:hydrogenase expression/formation protein HypC